MLSVPNRSEASSVGGPTNRQKGFAIVTRSSASVTLHLAPSGRGSDLVQADPRCKHRSGPLALGVEQARPPPIGARPSFERPPGAPRGLLMAVLKQGGFDRPRLGGRVVARLRTRSAAPWAWVSTPKLPPGGIQHCQPASSSSSRAVLWPYFAASYWQPGGRAPCAPRRAHGS